jgi:antitoxin CptB
VPRRAHRYRRGMSAAFATRLARAKFRAWHRGTREADFTIGGFFDRHHVGWDEADLAWFETLLEENDADILAWAMGEREPPGKYDGPLMTALKKLDFVSI